MKYFPLSNIQESKILYFFLSHLKIRTEHPSFYGHQNSVELLSNFALIIPINNSENSCYGNNYS